MIEFIIFVKAIVIRINPYENKFIIQNGVEICFSRQTGTGNGVYSRHLWCVVNQEPEMTYTVAICDTKHKHTLYLPVRLYIMYWHSKLCKFFSTTSFLEVCKLFKRMTSVCIINKQLQRLISFLSWLHYEWWKQCLLLLRMLFVEAVAHLL